MMDHEAYNKYKKLCEIKHQLIDWVDEERAKGKEAIDTKEMGEVIDMIKDLASAEKDCMESCYYETVVDAMHDAGSEYRMGYGGKRVNKRYPDDFDYWDKPYVDQFPYIDDYLDENGPYGYRGRNAKGQYNGRTSSNRNGRPGYTEPRPNPNDMRNMDNRYGSSYNRFREMRRHYTETGDEADRDEMSMRAREHLVDTTESIRDIWKDADPEMRRKIKADLTALASSLN